MNSMVRVLIISGLVLIVTGVLLYVLSRNGGWKMPGDIVVQRRNFTFYFPIVTSVILSIVLSLAFYLFRKFFR